MHRRRALVVDDQADIRRFVRLVLETDHDFEVIEAEDGLAGMGALAESTCDLLVTDLNMPGMTGIELLGYVRLDARHAEMATVVLTAHGESRDLQKLVALGAGQVLAKPISSEAFSAAVASAVPRLGQDAG